MNFSLLAQISKPDLVPAPVVETLLNIWKDFLGHTPLFGGGLAIVLATACVGRLFNALSERILRPFSVRRSIKELLRRFVYITIWLVGLLVAAMVVFPGISSEPSVRLRGLSPGILSQLLFRQLLFRQIQVPCVGSHSKIENVSDHWNATGQAVNENV